jgi:hypothetical protein
VVESFVFRNANQQNILQQAKTDIQRESTGKQR